jgi:23S rRNA (guanosine2251-2'-O)-methyltransferase
MRRIVCGPRAVEEALRAQPRAVHLLLLEHDNRLGPRLEKLARGATIAQRITSRAELDQLAQGLRHQGVVALTGDYPYCDLDHVVKKAERSPAPPLIVALDQVQDVHNVGSVVRTAVALGAQGLLLCRHGAAKMSPAAVRVSAGASEHAAITRVTNLSKSLEELRQRLDLTVVGLAGEAPQALSDVDLTGPVALVLGSEGSGLRRLVRRHCDHIASIPLAGPIASLNVSMAGAIALWETNRQRREQSQ